jgi:F420-dependent oxidoreductase-like protein
MQIGLHVPDFTWPGGPPSLGSDLALIARAAEDAGLAKLSVMDHMWQIHVVGPPEHEMLEAYTTLGYLAASTSRIELLAWVTAVVYREPGLLAKAVTTLDVLSGGRAWLGIGAAWFEAEAHGLGLPFPPIAERFERLEEALQICLQMWSDDNGPYEGTHYQLAETLCSPAPISSPRPRIMIGGSGERKTLRLVAKYADACNLFGDAAVITHKLDVLRRHCDDVGRDPATIEVTTFLGVPDDADVDTIVREAEALGAVGVHTVMARSTSRDPVRWLEEVWGPAKPKLEGIATA